MALTQLIPYSHTFIIVSLLLALMADLCLPLSAGEDIGAFGAAGAGAGGRG